MTFFNIKYGVMKADYPLAISQISLLYQIRFVKIRDVPKLMSLFYATIIDI